AEDFGLEKTAPEEQEAGSISAESADNSKPDAAADSEEHRTEESEADTNQANPEQKKIEDQ
ncbi:MAG: hypothetical protein KJN90_07675, partial [Gammaproteobacteria bacterium]|nr:hypothetical protein [Gammaproteobacteria bacterium]